MPLYDRDVNAAGRSSRASNLSSGSRAPPRPPPTAVTKTDMLTSAPGVMSMLKSSTELGTESLILPGSRFSTQTRTGNRRSGAASRMSTASSQSQQSRPTSGHHSHHAWPSVSSNGRRRSITSNFSNLNAPHYLDHCPPSIGDFSDPAALPPPAPYYFKDGGRSLSLTNSIAQPLGFANYRSLTSLRSHEPYQRPRSPYRYPTRLKRPGYRPSSPALSDVTGGAPSRGQHARLGSGLRPAHGAPFAHSAHGPHGSQGSYGSHGPPVAPIFRPSPLYYGPRNRSSPSISSIGPFEHTMPGMYPPASLAGSRQGTPSIPDHIYPMRAPTDSLAAPSSQSSSDPPCSTPPTPRNLPLSSTTEPAIARNGTTSVRRASNASTTTPAYYDYSEQFEPITKEITQVELNTINASLPLGFVQRIKTILEERAVCEHAIPPEHQMTMDYLAEDPPEEVHEIHELPASPVMKRITREYILSNLQPTSDEYSATPTITQTFRSKNESPSKEPLTSSPQPPIINEPQEITHERGQSKVSMRSDSTTATAAMDYALRYSPTYEQQTGFDDGNTMSEVLRGYRHEETHMTTVIEEPTEPVTVAMAEVEVAAPTPTQPRWNPPNFDTTNDIASRPRSALLPSSVYSSSSDKETGRFSTPAVRSEWLAPVQSERQGVPTLIERSSFSGSTERRSIPVPIDRRSIPGPFERRSVPTPVERPGNPAPAERRPVAAERRVPTPVERRAPTPNGRRSYSTPMESSSIANPVLTPESRTSLTSVAAPLQLKLGEPAPTPISTPVSAPVSNADSQGTVLATEHVVLPVSPLSELDFNHNFVFSPSPVSPLLSPDLIINKRESNASSHASGIWSHRKPLPKRPDSPASVSTRASIRDHENEQGGDANSTTDLRFSALGFRPLTRQLDDVKEEPGLECSSIDLRSSTFKFPLPQRKSSLAHFEEFRLSRESRRNASGESGKEVAFRTRSRALSEQQAAKDSPSRPPSGVMSLGDLRSIPSLHFSRVDLFSKLNDALDFQRDPSIDEDRPAEEGSSRPASTLVMRQKYRSFFESLDNMACDLPTALKAHQEKAEREQEAASAEGSQSRVKQVVLPKIKQWTPDDLIAELDRISIPSINGLTQRLSEMIPSLRRYYGEQGEGLDEDETVKTALDEIRRLGHELIPELSECGSSMSEYESAEGAALSKSSASLGTAKSSSTASFKGRCRSASSPGEVPNIPLAELEAPSPVLLRSQSLSDGNTGLSRAEKRRSLLSSPPESRPWNLDTSYPWADTLPVIDISLPAPTLRRDHIKPRPSKLRLRDDIIDNGEITGEVASIATATIDTSETASGADTFSNTLSRRRISKRSILGSLSRRIKLPRATSIDNSGYATAPDILRGEDRTVDPGDRYPTTGLSPPSALNIDEVRSFFSDDSSHMGEDDIRRPTLRKRLTNLKTKIPPMSRTHSAMENRAPPVGPVVRRSNSLFFARVPSKTGNAYGIEARLDEAEGMPRTEFRAKKLMNRMKTLWYKGGELLRTLSGKRKPRDDNDWDDSGESIAWSNA